MLDGREAAGLSWLLDGRSALHGPGSFPREFNSPATHRPLMLRYLVPSRTEFFELFSRSAEISVRAAVALEAMIEGGTDPPAQAQAITDLENDGDKVVHEIMDQLNRTFVTPLDREDIAALAHSLDDVLDMIEEAASDLVIYHVAPTPVARQLASLIRAAAEKMRDAILILRDRKQRDRVLKLCVEINSVENEADSVLRAALGDLFNDSLPVLDVIKWRTIYEVLEDATDRAEDVANILEGIVLKNA